MSGTVGIQTAGDPPSTDARPFAGGDHPQGTRGFTVLGHATGELAIWAVLPTGQPGWAAVERGPVGAERARALLGIINRQALVGVDRRADLVALGQLAGAAGVSLPDDIDTVWLDVFSMFADIASVRAELDDVREQLSYNRALPQTSGNLDHALAELRLVPPKPESAAAEQALKVCVLLRAAVGAWDDTEAARVRRKTLHSLGGKRPRAVPDRWLTALTRAYSMQVQF